MHARRSQARALFLTYVCCAFVAVLFAAPVLQSMASSSAAAGASVPNKTSKEKDR